MNTRIKYVLWLTLTLSLLLVNYANTSAINVKEGETQKAVLVTGASSGIGLRVTKDMAKAGYFVYAGARKDADLKALNEIENVQSVRLDVNKWDQINAAVTTIQNAGRGLHGIVNNAGVAVLEPLIEVEEDSLDFQFDVNIYGPYRITKAFAPMIIESKGHITTIGSIAGTLSGQFWGPYSMTKHAVEAYVDSLAEEMAKFEVGISIVEPGNYDSKIIASMLKRKERNKDKPSHYKQEFDDLIASYGADRSQFKDPGEVSEAIMHALFSDKPKHRYMVVPNKREATWTITQAMRRLIQQNHGQEHEFSREELIKIMDEMLKEVAQ